MTSVPAGSSRVLWVSDPWHTLDHPRETTLRLMEAGLSVDQEVHWCDVRSVRLDGSAVRLDACRLRSVRKERRSEDFIFEGPRSCQPGDFDFIHYRLDPPVDLAYLHSLQMLELGVRASGGSPEIVNSAASIFTTNEKFENAALAAFCPAQLVSSERGRLLDFIRRHERCVLKPLNNAGSRGIESVGPEDRETGRTEALLERLTRGFTSPVQLQGFIDRIFDYELRTLFLDGELIGAVRKKLGSRDFRINIDGGSSVTAAEPDEKELPAIEAATRHLRDRRIRFAALDLIGGLITDFNVTSPGLVVQMERTLGVDLATRIVKTLASPAHHGRT